MTIRAMSLAELEMVLGWAADEGWNPGLNDAKAFHGADPQGFLIKEVHGIPAAAISVVNHDPNFAFLGLYICKPEFRDMGYGMDIWRAGIAHAGARSIGLDGVPDQQANYAKSGFVKLGSTIRYEGWINAVPDPRVRRTSYDEIKPLIARDAKMSGMDRQAFAAAWFSPTLNRQTMVLTEGMEVTGFATFRCCISGTKIGPLYAASEGDAQVLLASNPFAKSDEPIFVDVQEQSSPLGILLQNCGFEPIFKTARMFRGSPPKTEPYSFQAIATMELG